MKMSLNRIATSKNPFQEGYKKVLCVCSAGLLRSPTAALVLSQPPYDYNTRAAGITEEYALIPVDDVLIHWADEIVCMEMSQKIEIERKFKPNGPVISLNIRDDFSYRDPELIKLIRHSYDLSLAERSHE
jgi:predicted protein tyrosine phosphatase